MTKRQAATQKTTTPKTTPTPAPQPDLLDMDQAIALLQTSRPTFYRWLRAGKIKAMKVGRQWRFYRADIQRFLQGDQPRIDVPGNISTLLTTLAERLTQAHLKPGHNDDPALEALDRIFRLAVAARASDIHFDSPAGSPQAQARLRFRLDGALHEQLRLDARVYPALIERLKTLAACDLHEKTRPQDGRIITTLDGQEVDLRVCFVPAVFGESATIRVLNRNSIDISLDRPVYTPAVRDALRNALRLPWGLIIVTGPAGSGKTTTLYASLLELDRQRHKIMTIEDPVEVSFDGLTQLQLRPAQGITYPYLLRAVFRCDPDVVMVGEIRDLETLQLCCQTALTGHLVLTTLHTDDTLTAVKRLADLGLDPFLIADATKLILAQRLVRQLCKECSKETTLTEDTRRHAARLAREGGLDWDSLPQKFRAAVGCPACHFTGYRGRTLLTELLQITPDLADAIRRQVPVEELRRLAVSQGMITLAADAIRQAAVGSTTLEEALRTAGAHP